MQTILEIAVSHDGRTLMAWDPNGEQEVASVEIHTGVAQGIGLSVDDAMGQAMKALAKRVVENREWFEGGM